MTNGNVAITLRSGSEQRSVAHGPGSPRPGEVVFPAKPDAGTAVPQAWKNVEEASPMTTLTVLAFPDADGAERLAGELEQLQKEQLIKIADGAIVVRRPDGKPRIKQMTNLVGAGAWGGAFWGMLIGLLFFMPWLGMGLGAVTGALAGKFSDIGIDDDFIKEVGSKIQPGSSALFLMTTGGTPDKIAERLPIDRHRFEILHTNLSQDDEDHLREVFAAHR
jgi:uncharacterized membrane protein